MTHEHELKCQTCGGSDFKYMGVRDDAADKPIHCYSCETCGVTTVLIVLTDTVGESTSAECAN